MDVSCTAEALQLLKEQQARDGAPGVDLILKEHDPPAANACRLLTRTLEDDVLRTVPVVGELTLSGSGRYFSIHLIYFKAHPWRFWALEDLRCTQNLHWRWLQAESITDFVAHAGTLLRMQTAIATFCDIVATLS